MQNWKLKFTQSTHKSWSTFLNVSHILRKLVSRQTARDVLETNFEPFVEEFEGGLLTFRVGRVGLRNPKDSHVHPCAVKVERYPGVPWDFRSARAHTKSQKTLHPTLSTKHLVFFTRFADSLMRDALFAYKS